MKTLSYHVMLRREPEDEVYTAWVSSLPGCVTFGKTIEKAIEMAKDAIEIYVETLISHAGKKLSSELKSRQVPLMALAAAFSFIIVMFNVPIPGGSTGHAVSAAVNRRRCTRAASFGGYKALPH